MLKLIGTSLGFLLASGLLSFANAQGFDGAGAGGQNSLLNISVDYQYVNMQYEEPGVMTEKGQFPGVRGQARLNVWGAFGISAGGSYFDGHLFYEGATFGGTPVTQTTVDYVRDVRYMAHLNFSSFEIAVGQAKRYWLNDLVISYKRRTEYEYMPIVLTFNTGSFYTALEYRIWDVGHNISTMSRVNPAARDVTFTQKDGKGYAFEFGAKYPFGSYIAKAYLAYDYWDVAASDIQNDNTQNLIEPKNNTTSYILGFGLGF